MPSFPDTATFMAHLGFTSRASAMCTYIRFGQKTCRWPPLPAPVTCTALQVAGLSARCPRGNASAEIPIRAQKKVKLVVKDNTVRCGGQNVLPKARGCGHRHVYRSSARRGRHVQPHRYRRFDRHSHRMHLIYSRLSRQLFDPWQHSECSCC